MGGVSAAPIYLDEVGRVRPMVFCSRMVPRRDVGREWLSTLQASEVVVNLRLKQVGVVGSVVKLPVPVQLALLLVVL